MVCDTAKVINKIMTTEPTVSEMVTAITPSLAVFPCVSSTLTMSILVVIELYDDTPVDVPTTAGIVELSEMIDAADDATGDDVDLIDELEGKDDAGDGVDANDELEGKDDAGVDVDAIDELDVVTTGPLARIVDVTPFSVTVDTKDSTTGVIDIIDVIDEPFLTK